MDTGYGTEYGGKKKTYKIPKTPRKSIVVPLNPSEKIELRFYSSKSDFTSWFGTTEELRNCLNTGKRG